MYISLPPKINYEFFSTFTNLFLCSYIPKAIADSPESQLYIIALNKSTELIEVEENEGCISTSQNLLFEEMSPSLYSYLY